jgi:hypothetical protein
VNISFSAIRKQNEIVNMLYMPLLYMCSNSDNTFKSYVIIIFLKVVWILKTKPYDGAFDVLIMPYENITITNKNT